MGKAAEEAFEVSEVEASTIHLASWLASRGRLPLPMVMEELSRTITILVAAAFRGLDNGRHGKDTA